MPKAIPVRRPESSRQPAETSTQRKEDKAFYKSTRWGKVRKLVMQRDCGLCQECQRHGRTMTGKQVDHIKPRKKFPALALDANNLEVLCAPCHNKKRQCE